MKHKMLTAIWVIMLGIFAISVVVDAGVDMKASDITNPTWLNSAPLKMSPLLGKVVMVEV